MGATPRAAPSALAADARAGRLAAVRTTWIDGEDGVATQFGQRRRARREHGRGAAQRFQHGQADPLDQRRVDERLGPTVQSRQVNARHHAPRRSCACAGSRTDGGRTCAGLRGRDPQKVRTVPLAAAARAEIGADGRGVGHRFEQRQVQAL
jgi:hypothetical protein